MASRENAPGNGAVTVTLRGRSEEPAIHKLVPISFCELVERMRLCCGCQLERRLSEAKQHLTDTADAHLAKHQFEHTRVEVMARKVLEKPAGPLPGTTEMEVNQSGSPIT